ncbi:MAG: 50S ribosomal protein L21 [Patescibacteria group bacterium]
MSKLAAIKTGGKQYIVKTGDELKIEKLSQKQGDKLIFDKILMVSDEKGAGLKVGTPYVEGAKVEAEVLEQGKSKKITAAKYKNKTRYHKVYGHRQSFTKVKIKKIS